MEIGRLINMTNTLSLVCFQQLNGVGKQNTSQLGY